MTKTLFEAIGYRLGQKAAQAKNAFDLVGGTEEDSLRAEIRLGRGLAAGLLECVPPVEENEATRFAAQIGRWLAGNVQEKKLPFIVRVTAEREPNALVLPGGPVFVSWALLEMCQGQRDEIAFVLGHEMGHIVRQHTLNRIIKDAALSLLLRQFSGRHAASAWLSQAGRQVLNRAFSRDDELEADAFAVALVRTSGGDALAGERLLEKLAQRTSGQSVGIAGDLLGHPPAAPRASRQSACQEAGLIRPILGASAAQANDESPVTTRQSPPPGRAGLRLHQSSRPANSFPCREQFSVAPGSLLSTLFPRHL